MSSLILTIIYTLLLLAASYFYLKQRYNLSKHGDTKAILRKYIRYEIVTLIVFLLIVAAQTWYAMRSPIANLPVMIKWSTLCWGLYLLALVDYKEKKIPNKIILVMLAARFIMLIYEIVTNLDFWIDVLTYCLLGAFIGGIIMFLCMFLSRNGLGMGDIKMFIVVGAYVGSSQILGTMFLAFLVSALGGLALLITKKAGLKDSIPMAPFTCCGVIIEYILLMLGGV